MTTDVIEHNPMLKKPLLAVLAVVAQQADESRTAVEERASATWDDAYQQSPATCVDILVRNDALIERLLVNGEPYDGTLDDLQLDPAVPDDAVAEARIAITETGRELLAVKCFPGTGPGTAPHCKPEPARKCSREPS